MRIDDSTSDATFNTQIRKAHKSKDRPGFTASYGVGRLVWYEEYDRIDEAIQREKSLKKWRRDWKVRLIGEMNLEWIDLYPNLSG
nr:GIY-YIG nuclease family protein [Methylobacterium sp.]